MLVNFEEPISETICESIYDFVNLFEAQEEFKKEFGVEISEWDNLTDDQTCIEAILEKMDGRYRLLYVDDRHCGYFVVETYSNNK